MDSGLSDEMKKILNDFSESFNPGDRLNQLMDEMKHPEKYELKPFVIERKKPK